MPFDRLVVGHGTPIARGGQELMATALRFLPPAELSRLPARSKSAPLLSAKRCG